MAILITGVTGHIGFRTLIHALDAGYNVRAAVRSQAKADAILNHPLIRPRAGSRLSFVIVPILTTPCAYDEAVRGVSNIIHIASPLTVSTGADEIPMNEQDTYFIQPAVRGTLNILEAAKKSGTVQRIVITSSLVALVEFAQLTGQEPRRAGLPIRPSDRVDYVPGPYYSEFEAYAASKVAALHEAESWMERHPGVGFDLIHLHPAFVQGRNDLATSPRDVLRGTNTLVLGMILGKNFDPIANATVHVEDVARVHVQALNPFIPGNLSYILSRKMSWNDAISIVEREFPEAIEKRMLPNSGSAENIDVDIDSSLTEDVFGFTHMDFSDQVTSVVGHFLEMRRKRQVTRFVKQDQVGGAPKQSLTMRTSA